MHLLCPVQPWGHADAVAPDEGAGSSTDAGGQGASSSGEANQDMINKMADELTAGLPDEVMQGDVRESQLDELENEFATAGHKKTKAKVEAETAAAKVVEEAEKEDDEEADGSVDSIIAALTGEKAAE